ncbi:MAG: hypothetical protein KDH09_20060 [Chrysiogenetes bacterium]|nr:hypothetical protein [Chrysiogenetes bacterium]
MKSFFVALFSCLLVAGVFAGCSSDTAGLPGISVGVADPAFSGADLAASVESDCSACDGGLDNEGLAGAGSDDAEALMDLIMLWDYPWLNGDDVTSMDTFDDVIATLGADPVMLTFNITRVTNCNSTGTTGSAAGDSSGGTIVETYIITSMFDENGYIEGSDDDETRIIAFNNCLIEGNLLGQPVPVGDAITHETAIRLNGGHVTREHNPNMETVSDPYTTMTDGLVILSTDGNGDGTFGNEFWTNRVNLDINAEYDGDTSFANGGVCAGEQVDLGNDDEDDSDDNCAETTDMNDDAWFPAGNFVF